MQQAHTSTDSANGTVGDFLTTQTAALTKAGITSARLDVLLMLEKALKTDRAHILAHPEQQLKAPELSKLQAWCRVRQNHVPIAYILGSAPFYGQDFGVNPDVLVPRPESEAIIAILLSLPRPAGRAVRVADIGTGSGCLAITAARELPPGTLVDACDSSPAALTVARENARMLDATIGLHKTNLLDGCPMPQDVILANLPYVPDDYPINKAATHEPRIALFAGKDGLDAYRTLFSQLQQLPVKPQYVITESLFEQHSALAEIASQAGYHQQGQANGLAQLFAG